MADVMVDGLWVASRAYCSDVKWSTHYGDGPCGPYEASFAVDIDPRNDSSWLRLGRVCEVWENGKKRFGGVISEMSRGVPREVYAKGWPRSNDRSSTFDGDRWGYDVNNVAYTPADPTKPSWWLNAEDLDIGVADDGLYTRVVSTYVSAVSGSPPQNTYSTVTVNDAAGQALYGVITYQQDLTQAGVISSSAATNYAQQQLNQFTVPQWLSRVAVDSTRLLTEGGLPAHLPSVQAGQMVRLFNVPNNLGGLRTELAMDVILGEVEYDTTDPSQVSLAPVQLAVRNIADLAAQSAQAAA